MHPQVAPDERPRSGSSNIPQVLWLTFFSLTCLLLVRRLVEQTMFFDGLIYAGLARNLANGVGSWWNLQFSRTMFPTFAEHPPLAIWLESLAFQVLGDSLAVEKCISFAMACLGSLIVAGVWRELNRDDPGLRGATPLVLIFALLGGRTAWAYANNMLENQLFVFTCASIYLTVRAYGELDRSTGLSRLPYFLASGVLISAAVMTKGLVGLFPLAAPTLYWLVYRRPSLASAAVDTIVTLACLLAVVFVATASPEARDYLSRYLETQLVASLSGARGYGGGGLSAISSLIEAFLKPAILTGMAVGLAHFVNRRSGSEVISLKIGNDRLRTAVFLALIGVSASFPILISPRVYRFYFNPSAPFYCSALAVVCAPILASLMSRLSSQGLLWLKWASVAALLASFGVVAWSAGGLGRDAAMLADIGKIGTSICRTQNPCDEIVQSCPALWQNYQFDSYMERHYGISVARQEDGPTALPTRFAIAVPECPAPSPSEFTEIDLGLETFKLFARRAKGVP